MESENHWWGKRRGNPQNTTRKLMIGEVGKLGGEPETTLVQGERKHTQDDLDTLCVLMCMFMYICMHVYIHIFLDEWMYRPIYI